tara:strand:+ start:322 stop:918 length:597 start_codon:yes stop_codon:yes gene_type:complete
MHQLKFMEIDMKYFLRASFLFLIFSDIQTQELSKVIVSAENLSSSETILREGTLDNAKVLINSFVYYDEFNLLKDNKTFNKIGKYFYEKDREELAKYISTNQDIFQLNKMNVLKVIELPGRGVMFSEGIFFIKFKTESAKKTFLSNFQLEPIDILKAPLISRFKVEFNQLEYFVNQANSSDLVDAAEIEMIDPYLILD